MGQSVVKYNQHDVDKYLKKLSIVGALSALFSDNDVPYLHYRVTENIYCNVFGAENLARADVSADAKLHKYGVGIKTFLERSKNSFEKVAEFNQQQKFYKDLEIKDKISKIAELRNNRLSFTQTAYNITDLIYHCVVRNKQGFFLFEEPMHFIDLSRIRLTSKAEAKNPTFSDGVCEYKFDISKSTLYKRFITEEYFASIDVKILADPLAELEKLELAGAKAKISEQLVVPLYSFDKGIKTVFPKSGLNIWNAGGRKRDQDEVYIPYPSELRVIFENFFPNRDTPFDVELPDGKTISMKVSQDNGKALTSNPNKALGKWILRDILKVPYGTVLTYDMLLAIGIDAVLFEKIDGKYRLDFVEVGGYEDFYYDNVLTDI